MPTWFDSIPVLVFVHSSMLVFSGPPGTGGIFIYGGDSPPDSKPLGGEFSPLKTTPRYGGDSAISEGAQGGVPYSKNRWTPPRYGGESSIVQGGVAGDGNEK